MLRSAPSQRPRAGSNTLLQKQWPTWGPAERDKHGLLFPTRDMSEVNCIMMLRLFRSPKPRAGNSTLLHADMRVQHLPWV